MASLRLTLVLLLSLALTSAVGTFLPQGMEPARYVQMLGESGARIVQALGLGNMYHSPWFRSILILLFLNMAACMIRRVPAMISSLKGEAALRRSPVMEAEGGEGVEESLAGAITALGYREREGESGRVFSRGGFGYVCTLGSHLSLLVIVVFSLAGSSLGFIGTQRVFVGGSTGTFFNWKTLSDTPLPFTLAAEEFKTIPNPIALKIGVLEVATGKKGKLITTHVGGTLDLPGLPGKVRLLGFDPETTQLQALWTDADGRQLEIRAEEPIGESGLALVTVAFALFPEKRAIARTSLIRGGDVIASGDIEVNHPLYYQGLAIFLTDYGTDPYGLPYVGYQIVKDPGQMGVWTGCILFLVFVTGALFIRHRCVVVTKEGGLLKVYLSSRGDRDKAVEELLEALATVRPSDWARGSMGEGEHGR